MYCRPCCLAIARYLLSESFSVPRAERRCRGGRKSGSLPGPLRELQTSSHHFKPHLARFNTLSHQQRPQEITNHVPHTHQALYHGQALRRGKHSSNGTHLAAQSPIARKHDSNGRRQHVKQNAAKNVITVFHEPSSSASTRVLTFLKQAQANSKSTATIDQATDSAAQHDLAHQEFDLDIQEAPPTTDQVRTILEYIGQERAGEIIQGANSEEEAVRKFKLNASSISRPLVSRPACPMFQLLDHMRLTLCRSLTGWRARSSSARTSRRFWSCSRRARRRARRRFSSFHLVLEPPQKHDTIAERK